MKQQQLSTAFNIMDKQCTNNKNYIIYFKFDNKKIPTILTNNGNAGSPYFECFFSLKILFKTKNK